MNWFLKRLTTSTARPERRVSLRVEGLEDRLALSTTPALSAPVSAETVRGIIVEGGRGSDRGIIIEGGRGSDRGFVVEGGRGSDRGIIAIHTGLESPLVARGFNPQPEPPGLPATTLVR